jgi:hypothetical protein
MTPATFMAPRTPPHSSSKQLEILYEGERHCISAVVFVVAGEDLN